MRPRSLLVSALFGLVSVALVATTLPGSVAPAGADGGIPACTPEELAATYPNCVPPPVIPPGQDAPSPPGPGAPDVGSVYTTQFLRLSVPNAYPLCVASGTSFYPCSKIGVGVFVWAYDSSSSTGQSVDDAGVYVYAGDCYEHNPCDLQLSWANNIEPVTLIIKTSWTDRPSGSESVNGSASYTFAVRGGNAPTTPTADFDATADTTHPGSFTFSSTSTDPRGGVLSHAWDFGDGTLGTGAFTSHPYTAPGDHTVRLTVTDDRGQTATRERTVTVAAPRLGTSIELLDGAVPPLEPDQLVRVRVRITASDDGVGSLGGLKLDGGQLLAAAPAGVFDVTEGPTPALPADGFSLAPGETRAFEVTLRPTTIGGYTLSTKVSGKDAIDRDVTAEATSRGVIGTSLAITIALDPPFADQEEGAAEPEPVDVEVAVTLKNTSAVTMTDVLLTSLTVTRTQPGQLLAVTQTGGVEPGVDGVPVGTLVPGEERTLTATFRATDDAEVEFAAMATAVVPGGGNEIGLGKKRWSVKPKYLVGLETTVERPDDGALLPAGETIRISGTVKNLSNTATLELGPLYPTLRGNAGVMSLTYDAQGGDPRALVPVGRITLEPGESQEFAIRILTSYSDPRRIEGDNRTGGTFAEITFTPYGQATFEDGEVKPIKPEQIKATEAALFKRVSIDDSITLPTFDPVAYGQAVLLGAVEGVWNATVTTLWGVVELAKMPYTTIRATAEFQAQVWKSFTEEERRAFSQDAGFLAYSVLIRNPELGLQNAGELVERAQAATLQSMIDMENEWRIGDYTSTTRLYTRFASDAIAQVVVPIALAKMAQSPAAVAALGRAQREIQARMAPILGELRTIERLEELGPILKAIESGVELLPEQLAVLYGITPEELGELQRLATKYNFLLTVRSRHASSIEWIERFGALLKPEAIKIKTVSELDARLGYRATDVGSLVFRKPDVLRRFEAGQGNIDELFDAFLRERGFTPGNGEWDNAALRVMDRIEEWQKYEATYKSWNKRGWIDVSFNYTGNAVTKDVRQGTGQYRGFKLDPVGEEEFVVQMMDGRKGRFVPITGDVDPIAFTHLDGSPLTVQEHAALLDDLRNNPLLLGQHGESATFVRGGVKFVVSQFKVDEPGLQIAPGGYLPRVVRLNPKKSRWTSPYDYHLHWDGGFVYSGSYLPRGANPRPTLAVPPATLPPAAKPRPLPRAVGAEPNVGRCLVTYSTAPGAQPLVLDADGRIAEVTPDGLQPSPLADQCFTEGEVVAVLALPTTEVLSDAAAGDDRVEIPAEPYLAAAGDDGLEVGQQVTIGAGTPGAVSETITGFGSIVLGRRLEAAHAAGEVIVVTSPGGDLPRTGREVAPLILAAASLVTSGAAMVLLRRRRRLHDRHVCS